MRRALCLALALLPACAADPYPDRPERVVPTADGMLLRAVYQVDTARGSAQHVLGDDPATDRSAERAWLAARGFRLDSVAFDTTERRIHPGLPYFWLPAEEFYTRGE